MPNSGQPTKENVMANQSYWNKVAAKEVANGQQAQNASKMQTGDREKYLAARKASENNNRK